MTHDEPKLPVAALERIDQACLDFEDAWLQGKRPALREFIDSINDPSERRALLNELLTLDVEYRRKAGELPEVLSYCRTLPDDAHVIEQFFARNTADKLAALTPNETGRTPTQANLGEGTLGTGGTISNRQLHKLSLGRYVILEKLGVGGFATVYRAFDQTLERDVAVKVPHEQLSDVANLNRFLDEARLVAQLNHPGIVPVFDSGKTDSGVYYVVSQLILGEDLGQRMRRQRMKVDRALEITRQIADALDYAHSRGFVHRDLKPSNIMLDASDRIFVTDFGLAFETDRPAESGAFVGTPAYMSPEQAAGESHLIDQRTDVFSLGVIFYELLTGRRPFSGTDVRELLASVQTGVFVAARQLAPNLPAEIDRMCGRLLANRISDRYPSMRAFLDELSLFEEAATKVALALRRHSQQDSRKAIVPKGLRSFDEDDAEFFLQLLPGPYDSNGVPECLRFWLQRMEVDCRQPFRVGLLSGPSGAGKSSLVRAGLIPRLSDKVNVIFVEASPDETEERVHRKVRELLGESEGDATLAKALLSLRLRNQASGRRAILLFDQFEQWLQAAESYQCELVTALRQCDGYHLQCLLLVRDEFAMEATRMLMELDVRIEQGNNFAVVTSLTKRHANQILIQFGQSLGCLPAQTHEMSDAQRRFVAAATDELFEQGKVYPVQLALLTELLRDRVWSPATLEEIGGTRGLGVVYLEERLGERTTHPECRMHREAARNVLAMLLPTGVSNIKGHHRTRAELLESSGYVKSTDQFDGLIRLLDRELRLITPAELSESGEGRSSEAVYTLAHDFLVVPLREWLTQKRRETIHGRAELCLEERASWWSDNKSARQLPSLLEWIGIQLFARSSSWTSTQRAMMRHANFTHLLRYGTLVLALLCGGILAWKWNERRDAQLHANAIANADTRDFPGLINRLPQGNRRVADCLQEILARPGIESRKQLQATVALSQLQHVAPTKILRLLAEVDAASFSAACECASLESEPVVEGFARLWQNENTAPDARFRAACALSQLAPERLRPLEDAAEIAGHLLSENLMELPIWAEMLRPMTTELTPALRRHFTDASDPQGQQLAATVLAELNRNEANELFALVRAARGEQLAMLLPSILSNADEMLPALRQQWSELFRPPPPPLENVSPRTAAAIKHANGRLFADHVFATQLDEPQANELTQELRRCGYVVKDTTALSQASDASTAHQVAVIWERGGLPSQEDDIALEAAVRDLRIELRDPRERQVVFLRAGKTRTPFHEEFITTDVRYRAASNEASRLFDVYWTDEVRHREESRPALDCRTTGGRIDFPPIPFHRFNGFTIEAWVLDWSGPILSQGVKKGRRPAVWLGVGDGSDPFGSMGWSEEGGILVDLSVGAAKLDGWNHVAFVFDGEKAICFLNGKPIANRKVDPPGAYPVTDGSPRASYGAKLLGIRYAASTRWGQGALGSVRVSSVARYTEPFTPSESFSYDDQSYVWIDFRKRRLKLPSTNAPRDLLMNTAIQQRMYRIGRHVYLNGFETNVHDKLCLELADERFRATSFRRQKRFDRTCWESLWTRSAVPPLSQIAIRRLANIGTALWRLGGVQDVLPALALRADNGLRSKLISRFADARCDPRVLLRQIQETKDSGIRQALVIALNEFGVNAIPETQRSSYLKELRVLAESDPDPGVHAAFQQLFRLWRQPLTIASPRDLSGTDETQESGASGVAKRMWYTTQNGHLMSVLHPPIPTPIEVAEHVNIDYRYSIDMRPVSRGQYRTSLGQTSSRAAFPVSRISWHDAARYCNWLSDQAELPKIEWCFEAEDEQRGTMRPVADYLEKRGFRLPTIAEWQYACAGGVRTEFFSGNYTDSLAEYAWDSANSRLQDQIIGLKKPNWCGLFDIHGSVSEWCVRNGDKRDYGQHPICGGSRAQPWSSQRIWSLRYESSDAADFFVGFRLARTESFDEN